MAIESEQAAGHEAWQGQTHYFCSKSCQEKFRAAPDRYAKKRTTPVPGGTATDRSRPTMIVAYDRTAVLVSSHESALVSQKSCRLASRRAARAVLRGAAG
ncbi:MAG: YHS domain-containing protein [Pseudomonadota bacterium]